MRTYSIRNSDTWTKLAKKKCILVHSPLRGRWPFKNLDSGHLSLYLLFPVLWWHNVASNWCRKCFWGSWHNLLKAVTKKLCYFTIYAVETALTPDTRHMTPKGKRNANKQYIQSGDLLAYIWIFVVTESNGICCVQMRNLCSKMICTYIVSYIYNKVNDTVKPGHNWCHQCCGILNAAHCRPI